MSRVDVVNLMSSSKSREDWDRNCDQVKSRFGGDYPSFWYEAIVLSGVAQRTAKAFGGSAEIHITSLT